MQNRLAIALIAAAALSSVGHAQGVPAKPQAPADAVQAAANGLGLLRGFAGVDISFSIEYDATGSMLVQGKMMKVPRYRSSIRFDVPGMRVDYDVGDGAQPQRHIDVVAGSWAWNEDVPGAGLANNENYGTATPAP